MQLASSLRLIAESDPLVAALDAFAPRFQAALAEAVTWRLGVVPADAAAARTLVRAVEQALRDTQAPLDRFFFDAFGGSLPATYGDAWDEVRTHLAAASPRKSRAHAYWSGEPCSMLIDEVEALWAPIADGDDWSPLHAKIAAIRTMGEALA